MAKLTPQQHAYVRKRSKVSTDEALDGELNIVPFLDIVINLVMFLLMVTASIASYTQVAVAMPDQLPSPSPGGQPGPESLGLNVILATSGIYVTTRHARIGAGCSGEAMDTSPTIPSQFGAYDWAALSLCVAQIRSEAEANGIEFKNAVGEGEVILSAEPLVEYQNLIHAMDSLREHNGRSLFPAVLLSAGVR